MNVYIPLLIVATSIIYYGSKRSLGMKEMETMSSKDAMMFPIVGSCVLFGLFLLFKIFAKEYLNLLFTFYFLLIGVFAIGMTILPLVEKVLGPAGKDDKPLIKFTMPVIPFLNDEATDVEITGNDLICYIVGASFSIWYATTKHWLSNDILGICFCIQAIEMMSLGTFKNGVILLCGLFIYDIFWVFGTGFFMEEGNSVMVSVAKNFDAPIKLLFPKSYPPASPKDMSMLGLGDIVIPGIFVALTLRFDQRSGEDTSVFAWTIGGYILGLATTVFVMHVFKAAQPALLYIVPACILTAIVGAQMKGKFGLLWQYSEQETEEEEKEAAEGKAETKKDA
jgi:minor histocompatibility antigen H13